MTSLPFELGLGIAQSGSVLTATGNVGAYDGSTTPTVFTLAHRTPLYSLPCTSGMDLYDAWLTISGTLPSDDGDVAVVQRWSLAPVLFECPPCTSTWNGIMQRLQRNGYTVIPVNPKESEILGERAYASLADIPVPVDIVSVFRRSEDTPGIADEAVAIGAKVIWLQSGISSEDTAARARAGGVTAVMDMCIATEHAYLRIPPKR